MKRFLIALVLVLATACSKSSNVTPEPDAGGPALPTLAGLKGAVSVSTDAHDVPHIHCKVESDCFLVQGYLQARDRLFPMDVARRVARGRLTEIIGVAGLSSDLYYRTLFTTPEGKRIEDALVASADEGTRATLQAYADGVNDYLAELRAGAPGAVLPAEYANGLMPPKHLTAADIPDWTLADTLAIGRLQQWALSESLEGELGYAELAAKLPADQLTAFLRSAPARASYAIGGFPYAEPPHQTLVGPHNATAQARTRDAQFAASLAGARAFTAQVAKLFARPGQFAGSNNWVVDGAHSASGKAMVCNDPHLALNYPPLFHLSHLTADDTGLDVAGGTFAGIPGMLIGRGAHVGWGVTVVYYDVTDLYLETLPDPEHVTFNGQSVALIDDPEVFQVRNSTGLHPETHVIRVVPHHGPLLGGTTIGGKAVSVRWTGQEVSQDLKAFLDLARATDVDSAFQAVSQMATGAQNFVFADDQGHIGYDPHAKVPIRPWAATNPPWLPLPGDGTAEWQGYIPDAELPQIKNPAAGFVATANADPVGTTDDNDPTNDKHYLQFDSDLGYRHDRIVHLLAAKPKLALADLQAIQADHRSDVGEDLRVIVDRVAAAHPAQVTSLDLTAAVAELDAWSLDCPTGLTGIAPTSGVDAATRADAQACLLFHSFWRDLISRVFADDFDADGIDRSGGIDSQLATRSLLFMLQPGQDPRYQTLCDDVGTAGTIETCDDAILGALAEASTALAGKDTVWGQVHTLTTVSTLPLVEQPFQAGPFARPGGAFTVDVAEPSGVGVPSYNPGNFEYGHGANLRWAAVMDGSQTTMQLPGNQRDGAYVPGAPGLIPDYMSNTYFDLAYTADQVKAASVATVTYQPKP